MKSNFLDLINQYIVNEDILQNVNDEVSNVLPNAENVQKAQLGRSLIGRATSKFANLSDTVAAMNTAALKGDLKGFVGSATRGIKKHGDINIKWLKFQDILKRNFVKDLNIGDIIKISSKTDLIIHLVDIFDIDIPNDNIEFKIQHIEHMHYNDFYAPNFDQLWGKIYALPINEEIEKQFIEKGVGCLFISFCVENVDNIGICTWVDRNLNPIAGTKQIKVDITKNNDGYYEIKNLNGNDVNLMIKEFLNTINKNNSVFTTPGFIQKLISIVNTLSLSSKKYKGSNSNEAIFKQFYNLIKSNLGDVQINDKDIRDYFTTTAPINLKSTIKINQVNSDIANYRKRIDAIIQNEDISQK